MVESSTVERPWDVGEVAEYLRKSKSWVYLQVARGVLPHSKVGADIRFLPSEIYDWLRKGGMRPKAV